MFTSSYIASFSVVSSENRFHFRTTTPRSLSLSLSLSLPLSVSQSPLLLIPFHFLRNFYGRSLLPRPRSRHREPRLFARRHAPKPQRANRGVRARARDRARMWSKVRKERLPSSSLDSYGEGTFVLSCKHFLAIANRLYVLTCTRYSPSSAEVPIYC